MATLNENLSQIRLLLGQPDPQNPSAVILFELLNNQVQHHINQLQNSSAAWSVASIDITTGDGQEDYLLTATDFGKPFLVYTADSSDISHVRREVPFVTMQNVDQFYRGVQQTQISDYHTAQTATFYRSNGSDYLRLTPIPGGAKTYTVWYETTGVGNRALGDAPGLSPFHHLIRVQTALAALPHCAWGNARFDGKDKDARAWERKTRALGMALAQDEAKFQKEFSTYLGTLMQAGVEDRQPFGGELDTVWWV